MAQERKSVMGGTIEVCGGRDDSETGKNYAWMGSLPKNTSINRSPSQSVEGYGTNKAKTGGGGSKKMKSY